MPDAATYAFLKEGGIFALLCLVVIGVGVGGFVLAKRLLAMLSNYLAKMEENLVGIKETQNKTSGLLEQLTIEIKELPSDAEAMQRRLDVLERRLELVHTEIIAIKERVK